MKRVILILIFAGFLTACGGGGGNTPTVQMPDNPPGQTDNGENDNPQMDDMQTDNGGNDSPVKSEYDDAEFNANYSLRQMNALYAYENGYFGQGVTIATSEEVRETHEELAANAVSLTTTIAGIGKPVSSAGVPRHGTQVIGVAVAARNGKGFHGVAPQAKFLSFDSEMNIEARRTLFMELGIPIYNSPFSISQGNLGYSATLYATQYAGLDIVHVNSRGNTDLPSDGAPLIPIIEPSLEPQWIVVAGLNEDNTLHRVSLECGEGKRWCISAYSSGFPTTAHESDSAITVTRGGTSIAAPQVSGALAVLKSAADMLVPQMSAMTTVRLILLETATPLYADASKNGVRIMENGEPVLSSVYGWGAVNIGAGITHLQGIANQMSSIKQMQVARLGGAAKLANGNKFAPANDKNTFRFWGGIETENAWTGIATQEYGGISGFAEYGKANMRINSFLTNGEIRNAESQSWTAGIQFGDLIRHNDNLRFSAREESRISDGELILQYSFGKQIRIPIKQKPQTIYTAGYSQKTENSKWSAAAEWNSATNAKGVSFAIELQIR